MAAFGDLVRFNPTLGGTTDWVFSSIVAGCQSPASAGLANGVKFKTYAISSDFTQWEVSEGALNSSTNTFPRTTVLYNSSGTGTATGQSGAGTKINFSTVPQVAVVALAEDLISVEVANNFTAAQQAQARSNIGADLAIQHQLITATGSNTFTTPSKTISTTVFKVTLLGAGGGGGAGDTGKSGGGGGAGGGLIKYISGLSASTGFTITIGTAGTGGTNPSGNGGNGGNSTAVFGGTTLTANGGSGGLGGQLSAGSSGGAGGAATNGDINITGQPGSTVLSTAVAGAGGNAAFGLGAGGGFVSGANGVAGTGFGAGGSGGSAAGSVGAAGSNGACLIEWVL